MVLDSICQKWEAMKNSLMDLENICIRKCTNPEGFGTIKETLLHHFSDVSKEEYGQ